ncbi:FAR1 DNA binding domain-containing protein [Artemisia annua]|uniref:FAR1 DNA binding domain-containing protein n=1 Tax=Artemisia annua TaxID=35608 RepID=A0A2U1LIB9_ARTAN|nr:FAR1 DNA binding domain-containing protein [Artemisia annua]
MFMQQLGGTNIGATRAHHLYAATNGGYDEVDATETEFRNQTRDLNSHIGDSDAQMLINKMENRVKYVANFTFEYVVEDSQLNRLFWADEMAKYNYKEFGDTISFDATFRTNKEGLAKGVNKDTMNEETSDNHIRTSSISRTGCMARVKFKLNESHTEYVLYDFVEEHNHTFIPVIYRNLTKKKKKLTHREKMFMQQLGGKNIGATRAHHLYAATNGGYDEVDAIYRNLTKKKKKLTHREKMFMQQLGGTNIGATRAHHLYAATNGGYDEVDATETEFRNQTRDLNSHIGDSDAQMLINKMENRVKNVANFTFEYAVEDSQLNRLFWADEMAKYNYKEFGDTISFDATFRTNKFAKPF